MPSEDGFCKICRKSAKKRCSRCQEIWYCSSECQQNDWKMHKRTCLAPIDRNVQGIFFEAGHDAPSVINVPLKTDIVRDIFDIGAQEVKMPIFLPLLGDGHRGHLRITTDGMNGKQLEQQYILFFRDDFLNDGSPPNNIPKILTNGRAPHPWAGNLLALKETYFDSGMWADCTIEEDLPTLVRYFEWYPSLDPGYRPQIRTFLF